MTGRPLGGRRLRRFSAAGAAAALLVLAGPGPGAALAAEGGLVVIAPDGGVLQLTGLAPGHPAAAVAVVANQHDRAIVATVDAQIVPVATSAPTTPTSGLVLDVALCAAPWAGTACPDGRIDVPAGVATATDELAAGSQWYVRVAVALDPAAGNETQRLRASVVVVLTATEAAGAEQPGGGASGTASELRDLAPTGLRGWLALLGVALLATATGAIAVVVRRRA